MSKEFTGDYDLFNNPMIDSARKAMTNDDLKNYEDWGKYIHESIDFETGTVTAESYPTPMMKALVYLEDSLRSGQHPSTLTDDEKDFMLKMKGDTWFEKWGYTAKDLDGIQ